MSSQKRRESRFALEMAEDYVKRAEALFQVIDGFDDIETMEFYESEFLKYTCLATLWNDVNLIIGGKQR